MNNAFLQSFQVLNEVYVNQSFSSIALNKALTFCKQQDKSLVTKIVYGVLDEDIKLEYVLSKYVKKMPKGDVLICFKIGLYCLMNLSIPPYAVVNDVAELAKITEDRRQVGFVNATLKRISTTIKDFDDYPKDKHERLSVVHSYPLWAVKKVVKDYGFEQAEKIISFIGENRTTARFVGLSNADEIQEKYGLNVSPTLFNDAFYVQGKLPQLDENFTVQSLSSMAVSRICASGCGDKFLDCCSAPGGKAIYLKQLSPQTDVTCCDIHPHRVDLIKSYACRMQVEVNAVVHDMTEPISQFVGAFDTVLCDVPCSGFGVLNNHPDIKLFRKNEDISSLMKLQQAILQNCSNYVKVGGRLIFSTCTIFDNENGQNIRKFLKNNTNFEYSTIDLPQVPNAHGKQFYQFLPHEDGVQGFYVAVLTRKE